MVTPQASTLTARYCREGVALFRTESFRWDEARLPPLHSWPRSMVWRILPFLHLPVNMSDEGRRSPPVSLQSSLRGRDRSPFTSIGSLVRDSLLTCLFLRANQALRRD